MAQMGYVYPGANGLHPCRGTQGGLPLRLDLVLKKVLKHNVMSIFSHFVSLLSSIWGSRLTSFNVLLQCMVAL